jgi:SAM-dependent methyltransferase
MQATSPFDTLATTYDDDFTTSRIGQLQRKRVWKYLLPMLNESGDSLNILEIGCGTGEDALRLASMGHKVVATDASAAMIGRANEKMSRTIIPLTGIRFNTCSFDQLKDRFSGQKFDLVFSNFGGLNCIDKKALVQLRDDLGTLLTADGKLFVVLMGSCCIREIVHFGIRGKWKTAFRRFKRTVDFSIGENSMPVYYYSPALLKTLLRPTFKVLQKWPVGLFIPPSYLENRFVADEKKLYRLEKKEEKFGSSSLAGFADHYCAIFYKLGINA